jgi:hypothetical protein
MVKSNKKNDSVKNDYVKFKIHSMFDVECSMFDVQYFYSISSIGQSNLAISRRFFKRTPGGFL